MYNNRRKPLWSTGRIYLLLIASLCAFAQEGDTQPTEFACGEPDIAHTALSWAEAAGRVLPTIVTRSSDQTAACKPFANGIQTCHILLTGRCARLLKAADVVRWQVSDTELARRAIENLDRLAAPVDLNIIWLETGLPEDVSHSSSVATAAAWVLTTSFQEKLKALQPGAWFVAMPQSDYIFAWPAGQSKVVVARHVEALKDMLSIANENRQVLTEQVFVLQKGHLRIATLEEVRSVHIAANL